MGSSSSHYHLEHGHCRENPSRPRPTRAGQTPPPPPAFTVSLCAWGWGAGNLFQGSGLLFFTQSFFWIQSFRKHRGFFSWYNVTQKVFEDQAVTALQSPPFSGDPQVLTPATSVLSTRTRPLCALGMQECLPSPGMGVSTAPSTGHKGRPAHSEFRESFVCQSMLTGNNRRLGGPKRENHPRSERQRKVFAAVHGSLAAPSLASCRRAEVWPLAHPRAHPARNPVGTAVL